MTIADDLDRLFGEAERRMMLDHRLTPKEFVEKHRLMAYPTYWKSARSERADVSDATRTKNLREVEEVLDRLDEKEGVDA